MRLAAPLVLVVALAASCAKSGTTASSSAAATKPTPTSEATSAQGAAADAAAVEPVEIPPDIYGAVCNDQATPFDDILSPIAEDLQSQKIWYTQDPSSALQDCSGIFHRVLQGFDAACPGKTLPTPDTHRTSRQLGAWYLERGLLTVIEDAAAQDDLIHPGTVLFFGPGGVNYTAMPPADAMEKIRHVGVVVDTARDEDGALQSYSMFHGRRTGTYAGITNWHKRSGTPPLGNGNDAIIGATPIVATLGNNAQEVLGVPTMPGEVMLTCNGETVAASDLVTPVAESLKGKTVRVRWNNERDKVRVFTVLAEKVAEQCPELVLPDDTARESHQRLAQWYVAEGRFEVVTAAAEQGAQIVAGSVLFFGPASVDYAGLDPEEVLSHINHMGVVVSVTRDDAGAVTGYTLFQAPPEGAFAAEFREGNSQGAALSFGLDGLAWLGVAPISAHGAGGSP